MILKTGQRLLLVCVPSCNSTRLGSLSKANPFNPWGSRRNQVDTDQNEIHWDR